MYHNQGSPFRDQGFMEPSGGFLPPNYTGAPYPSTQNPQTGQNITNPMATPQQANIPTAPQPTGKLGSSTIYSVGNVPIKGPYGNIGARQEESYIENILRVNVGKLVRIYMTYDGSKQWTDKTYEGILEAAGRDHILIRDTQSERRYLLLMIYLDYVEFFERINYYYYVNGYYIANFTEKDLDPKIKNAIFPTSQS